MHGIVILQMSRDILQLHQEEVIPEIDRPGKRIQHTFLRVHGTARTGVRTGQVAIGTKDRHHPRIEQLDFRSVLYGIQQVPLVDDANGVVVVGR